MSAKRTPDHRAPAPVRIVRTRRGVRLVQGRDVLSDVLARPGATGGFFDALAASIATFAPVRGRRAPRVALLGFAAGGVVPPLRALGFPHAIDAVDLSLDAVPLFRAVTGERAGIVRVHAGEASAWLRRRRPGWDVVVDDLTVPGPEDAIKPAVSWSVLPSLVHDRLAAGGVAIVNALPVPGMAWDDLLDRFRAPHRAALCVRFDDYVNRIVIAGDTLPLPRIAGRRLRAALGHIGSRQAEGIAIRAL